MYTRQELANQIIPLLETFPVKRSAMFGSYARNEQTPESDIDLLLDLDVDKTHPFIDYVYDLLSLIESKVKLSVDFITVNSLKDNPSVSFKEKIDQESWWFYEV